MSRATPGEDSRFSSACPADWSRAVRRAPPRVRSRSEMLRRRFLKPSPLQCGRVPTHGQRKFEMPTDSPAGTIPRASSCCARRIFEQSVAKLPPAARSGGDLAPLSAGQNGSGSSTHGRSLPFGSRRRCSYAVLDASAASGSRRVRTASVPRASQLVERGPSVSALAVGVDELVIVSSEPPVDRTSSIRKARAGLKNPSGSLARDTFRYMAARTLKKKKEKLRAGTVLERRQVGLPRPFPPAYARCGRIRARRRLFRLVGVDGEGLVVRPPGSSRGI